MLKSLRRPGLLSGIRRECLRLAREPLYWFCMVVAPLFCYVFLTSLMASGLPQELPLGIVDNDRSATSRQLTRNLDAFQQTDIVSSYASVTEARKALQRGDIYGFYYIPEGTSRKAQRQEIPTVSFYMNHSYIVAGSLLFRDMKMMSELASGAASRTVLYAKGATERQAMAYLQPVVINSHPLNNPWLNYSVYLCNTLVPGMLMLFIFMITVYSIGVEIKDGTAEVWLTLANGSLPKALFSKLLPQTVIFWIMGCVYLVWLYGVLDFPCHGGILSMLLAMTAFVLASQGLGVFMVGALPSLRYALSFASLWGVVSFSISGMSFPLMAMHPSLQALSVLFPLRHYFIIYVNSALNGYPLSYVWPQYFAFLLFVLLPVVILPRLKKALLYGKYMP